MTTPRAVLLLATFWCVLLVPSAAPAQAADNVAVAINTRDGSTLFRIAFKIQRTMQPVVDDSNAAVAFASCDSCTTVAIAMQAVLIMSDPTAVTSQNIAIAYNYQCTSCSTLASAYQWVFTTGGIVRFTSEGSREIAQIRRELQQLRQSESSIVEIQQQVDALAERLQEVLATQVVAVGPGDDAGATGESQVDGEPAADDAQPLDDSGDDASEPSGSSADPSTTTTTTTPTETTTATVESP